MNSNELKKKSKEEIDHIINDMIKQGLLVPCDKHGVSTAYVEYNPYTKTYRKTDLDQ